MKKLCLLLYTLCLLLCTAPVHAATKQPLSPNYIDSYFTTMAAASCLGVYLPQQSTEFDYLRSYGWNVVPQVEQDGNVETHFAIAKNRFAEINKDVYLVTFRGTNSKKDWKINLKTKKVAFGGTTLPEMQAFAKAPAQEYSPEVHAGFNEYVDTVLRTTVVNPDGSLKGIFRDVMQNPNTLLLLSGHSLGGAAATLLGERLVAMGMPKERMKVITFGAPAIGNEEFATTYGDAIDLIRITNTADPIPGSLQTFFGQYKQFGKHVKYTLSPKINSVQHDMAMYFDYSVADYYAAFDRQAELGRLVPARDTVKKPGVPTVALWVRAADNLHQVAGITDIKRMTIDAYKRMLPSYMLMEKSIDLGMRSDRDLIQLSKDAGADYVLICGVDGERPRNQTFWYLNLEQELFDKNGRMLSMSSFAKKVAPAVGNVQAVGENIAEAYDDLQKSLPFVHWRYDGEMRFN